MINQHVAVKHVLQSGLKMGDEIRVEQNFLILLLYDVTKAFQDDAIGKDRSATRPPRGFVECSIDLAIDFFGNKCWIEPKGYNKPL